MPLLRDGTVLRVRLTDFRGALDEDLASREVAPIEDVTQIVEGLDTAITFTFRAVKGEETQPSYPFKAGYTILCAEDNTVIQRLLCSMLHKFGQDHAMTRNGEQAVEVYMSNPERFPCIFMDISMPVMGGREATRRIRAFESSRPGHRRAFIVGLLAHTDVSSPLFADGFDILMRKPITKQQLHEMFLGGPQTNIVMLYGSLTEEEKSAYPRREILPAAVGDDPRSNAIIKELKRQGKLAISEGIHCPLYREIRVKVVKPKEE